MMNRTPKRPPSNSGGLGEDADGSTKRITTLSPKESDTDNQQSNESGSTEAKYDPAQYNAVSVAGLSYDNDIEAYRLHKQQPASDRPTSLVAVAAAEDRDRKMAAVTTTTALLQSTDHPHSDELGSDRLVRNNVRNDASTSQPLYGNNDRLANIRLQQQILLYQQQQQQQLLLLPNISSVHPPDLIRRYNLQYELALRDRQQLQALAMHQQGFTNHFSSGMLHSLRLDNVDAQFRQRQLLELAMLQNQQHNLWMTANSYRLPIIPSATYQNSQQQCLLNNADANLSTHVTTASSHLSNEIRQPSNVTIDAMLQKHLPTAKTTARQQKRKSNHVVKDTTKSSKSKSIKVEPDAKLEYNFEPENMRELSLPTDSENLSEYQCLLRQQIVLFTVGSADIECSAQGRNKPIVLGQVGTLCRYCAKLKPGLRPSGAVYFPAKLSGLYQASQNMAINHFSNNCQSIPEPLRQRLLQLKERKSTVLGGGKTFWANCAKVIGVIEQGDQLRFSDNTDTARAEEKAL